MKTYTIEDILEYFIYYRRFVTGDSIDPIGQTDFEREFMAFILYMKNCTTPDSQEHCPCGGKYVYIGDYAVKTCDKCFKSRRGANHE